MILRIRLFFILMVAISGASVAQENVQLQTYFSERLGQVQVVLDQTNQDGNQITKPDWMQLQGINIVVGPVAAFGLSKFIQLTVSPELDFVLTPVNQEQ